MYAWAGACSSPEGVRACRNVAYAFLYMYIYMYSYMYIHTYICVGRGLLLPRVRARVQKCSRRVSLHAQTQRRRSSLTPRPSQVASQRSRPSQFAS